MHSVILRTLEHRITKSSKQVCLFGASMISQVVRVGDGLDPSKVIVKKGGSVRKDINDLQPLRGVLDDGVHMYNYLRLFT